MRIWIVFLKAFGYIWMIAAALLILIGIAGTWMKGGFSAVQDLLSPFNLANWIVTVITVAPGIGALIWAEKLNAKLPARAPRETMKQRQIRKIAKNKAVEDVARWKQGLADLSRDHLTGLHNQRGFERQFETFKSAQQNRMQVEPATLIYVDLDRFKGLIDGLGQAAGDSALRHIATVLQKQIHDRDLVARCGDDEFAVWLPGTPLAEGMEVAERIRRAVEMEFWRWNGTLYPITASLGVAACPENVLDVNTLRGTADAAVFKAKQEGRNRVQQAVPNLS